MKTFKTFCKEAYINKPKSIKKDDADIRNIFNAAGALPYEAFLMFINDDYTIIKK